MPAAPAVTFDLPFDGLAENIAKLSPLDAAVDRADIVFLGELNHFVHEKNDFRLLLLRYLASRGWTVFGEELSWSDGVRVGRFITTGDDRELERVTTFGYEGCLREDRDDRPAGILGDSSGSYPTELFRAEQARLYRGIRDINGSLGSIRYFGFDIDALPGGGYEDIAELLAPVRDAPEVIAFLHALARVPGESVKDEVERLEQVRSRATGLRPRVSSSLADQVTDALDALIASLRYVDAAYTAKDYDALRPAMAMREDAMKRRVDRILSFAGENAKVVLMGHAMHLAKDDAGIESDPSSVGPGGGLVPSLGHYIAQERGLRVFSVWMLYGEGEDSQPFATLPRRAQFPPHTLNAILGREGRATMVPTARGAEGIFTRRIGIGHMYNSIFHTVPSRETDAILFLPRVSPLRY